MNAIIRRSACRLLAADTSCPLSINPPKAEPSLFATTFSVSASRRRARIQNSVLLFDIVEIFATPFPIKLFQ